MPASQSITCVSSSVHAGDVLHSMPCTPRPALRNSPRMLGPLELAGKYAKKFGLCQCVTPGSTMRSTSAITASHDSPSVGGAAGSWERTQPGSTVDCTGWRSMPSR